MDTLSKLNKINKEIKLSKAREKLARQHKREKKAKRKVLGLKIKHQRTEKVGIFSRKRKISLF